MCSSILTFSMCAVLNNDWEAYKVPQTHLLLKSTSLGNRHYVILFSNISQMMSLIYTQIYLRQIKRLIGVGLQSVTITLAA